MANRNRNRQSDQSWQSNQEWDLHRRRVNQENDYQQDYENYGSENLDYGTRFDDDRDSRFGSWRSRQQQSGYGSGTNAGQYGNYGAASYGNQFGHQNQNRNRTVGNTYGDDYDDDFNRNRLNRSFASGYGTTYNNPGGYGQYSGAPDRNIYGGDTRNYGNANQGGMDRDWWERTRDEVSSWFGDDDAKRRRRMDKQFQGEHRGKGPRGYTRSDDRIREDVSDRLSDDPFLDATDVDVKVEQCEVILTGTVSSREDKRRAEDLVERISGVTNVENRLKVKNNRDNERSEGRFGYENRSQVE